MQKETKEHILSCYENMELIRKSERSEVWIVLHPLSQKLYVKRILPFSESSFITFQRLKTVNHPNLLNVVEVICLDEKIIIIEEFIEGRVLSELLDKHDSFSEKEVVSITEQLCKALAMIHSNGIVHRDIKPSNIMVDENGLIKLIDFDASRIFSTQANQDTKLLGTEGYAPPEQYGFAQTDSRTDIYSLGITIKELLDKEYKGRMSGIIKKCTRVDPEKRFQSIAAIEKKLYDVKHPLQRLCKIGSIAFILIVAVLFAGNYAYEAWRAEYINSLLIDENQVELQYAVNQSEQDAIGMYDKDGDGSLLFFEDHPLPNDYRDVSDLWPNARYITYTIPRSFVKFSVVNNSDYALVNPSIRLDLNDFITWDENSDIKGLRYDNHMNGVGAYGAVIWEPEKNIKPKANEEFKIGFNNSAVIGKNPYVKVTVAAENYPARTFHLPIGFYDVSADLRALEEEELKRKPDPSDYLGIDLCGLSFAEINNLWE